MTVFEIKKAVDEGENVFWKSKAYKVIKDSKGQYMIHCLINESYIGLTWADNVTLNGEETEFYIEGQQL